jgi:thioredoxin 1
LIKIKEFNLQNFEQEVLASNTPVLVDFGGGWCVPCQQITPVLHEIAKEFQGALTVGKVDVDQEAALALKYCVRSVPSLLIFKQGQVVDQVIGAVTKQSLATWLHKTLGHE